MIHRLDIRPETSGVVYSPGRKGWVFYPEPRLLVGLTGTQSDQTAVRSVLSFSLPDLDADAFLVRACLHLYLVRNEPGCLSKLICLRETPAGVMTPWTLEQEYGQAALAEVRLTSESEIDLEFPMTGTVMGWRRGAPNNGVLLDFGYRDQGLVGFDNGREQGPRLMLEYVVPAGDATAVSLEAPADGTATSREMPCRDWLVKNLGPGLAWVTPLFRLGRGPLLDPAGLPLGVLDPGGYLLVQPGLPAEAMAIRVQATLTPALVVIVPLKPEDPAEPESRRSPKARLSPKH
ncbi:MAG: hypothetical protein ACM3X6_01150 [Patescibacteria group bacterium]